MSLMACVLHALKLLPAVFVAGSTATATALLHTGCVPKPRHPARSNKFALIIGATGRPKRHFLRVDRRIQRICNDRGNVSSEDPFKMAESEKKEILPSSIVQHPGAPRMVVCHIAHPDGYISASGQEVCLLLYGGSALASALDRLSDEFRSALAPPAPAVPACRRLTLMYGRR